MAGGLNPIANLLGKTNADGALVVALDGDAPIDTTGEVNGGSFAVGGVPGFTGTIDVMASDGVTPLAITVVSGLITGVA